jgi:cytochrome c553
VHSHAVDQPELVQQGRALFEQGVPAKGVAACTSCHGAAAQGSATLPRLAGQHAQYTERQLRQFSTRERSNDNAVMHQVASQLSPAEMRALASYLSGLK